MSQLVQQPSFKNPPVVETALSIQFNEIAGFNNTHFGLFHQTIKPEYPHVREQPRLDPVIERFPGPVFVGKSRFQIENAIVPQRMWFVNENDSELIQLQPDRIVFNWRQKDDRSEYPRYATNGPKCIDAYSSFVDFCESHQLDRPVPNLAEVAYVNHIVPVDGESAVETFARSFAGLDWKATDGFLPSSPETALFNRVYVIGNNEGRLFAEASIILTKESSGKVQLKVTARVNHVDAARSISDSLQLAHDWVVNGFVSLTTPEMHKHWGLQR
ncbi:MAG: TIGR04255 family protein [Planctomycetes bacterium]|nr:TIGR04255 family protein [Planctomycetota bacterium]